MMTEDLFEPIVVISPRPTQTQIDDAVKDNPSYNREFVWIAIVQSSRDSVNERWEQVKQFCEPNFVTEFRDKEKFSSKLWELNLRYLFLSRLTRKPSSGEPDLIATSFVAECVVPAPSDVPDMVFDGLLYNYPTDEIARRVTTALVAKQTQFNTRSARTGGRINYAETPYIIAVGLPQREFRSAMHMSGMDIVETVLMGAGPLQITISSDGSAGSVGVSSQGTMQTRNGVEFDIAYFQRDEWKGVSAVLWSSEWLPEISDIKVLLNPNATLPLVPADLDVLPDIITYTKTRTGYTRNQRLNQ